MDRFPQMVYRAPGTEPGVNCETRIVSSDDELDTALDDGWHETATAATDALAAYKAGLVADAAQAQQELIKAAEQALLAPLQAQVDDLTATRDKLAADLKAEQEAHAATRDKLAAALKVDSAHAKPKKA